MYKNLSPILIVEDRATDLDLTKRALAKRRVLNPIQEARDGEQALAYIKRWEDGEPLPVFILLDLRRPKVDGLEVLRQLKANRTSSSIPVIVLTTSAEDGDIQEAYRLGCNSYIVKPIDFNRFMEVASHIDVYWSLLNTVPTS
jgi:CheY-like chemotaxis protein